METGEGLQKCFLLTLTSVQSTTFRFSLPRFISLNEVMVPFHNQELGWRQLQASEESRTDPTRYLVAELTRISPTYCTGIMIDWSGSNPDSWSALFHLSTNDHLERLLSTFTYF